MADVTDTAFRRIIAEYSRHGQQGGGPDVFYTEFVSADGLLSPGRAALERDLMYTESERPIVAQLFTGNPENMERAARIAVEHGFDGVDINMGCPDKSVEKQGAGASLIKDPARAQELICAAQRGAQGLPVSVKTRVGYNKNELDTWIPALLETHPAALIIHARTRKEMSKVDAHWEDVFRAVQMRDEAQSETLIVGNGDVASCEEGEHRIHETGADGVMVGRGIFGNPWFFDREARKADIPLAEQLRVMVEHTKLFEDLLGDVKSFAIMKKHYKAYVTGFDGAKELRMKLMEAKTARDVEQIVKMFLLG